MIRNRSSWQLTLAEVDWPLRTILDENNRWVKLAECIPWDELARAYHGALSQGSRGRPSKCCLSDYFTPDFSGCFAFSESELSHCHRVRFTESGPRILIKGSSDGGEVVKHETATLARSFGVVG